MRFNILYPLFILFAVVHAAPVGEAPSAAGLNQEAIQAGSSDLAIPSGAIQALQENEVGVVFSKEGTRDSSQDSKLDTLFFENSPVKVSLFRNLRANYRIFGDKAHSSPECPFVQFITFDKEGRIYDVKMSTRDAYNNWSSSGFVRTVLDSEWCPCLYLFGVCMAQRIFPLFQMNALFLVQTLVYISISLKVCSCCMQKVFALLLNGVLTVKIELSVFGEVSWR
ncbi:hypothetical protein FB446DRAFT_419735 [Lentinula raphanica]|nr:hypothetical protein FB446DRAFT_419735 [Lentinula raphanica]